MNPASDSASSITCPVCNNVTTFDPAIIVAPRSCPICDSPLAAYANVSKPPTLPDPAWQAAVTARNKTDMKKIAWLLLIFANPISLVIMAVVAAFLAIIVAEGGLLGIAILGWLALPFAIIGILLLIAWLIYRHRNR